MPKQKRLSGKDVVSFCEQHGFTVKRQKGSHLTLARFVAGEKQVVTVPNHKELDRGTLNSIFKKLSAFIPEKILEEFFYTK